MRKIFFLIFFFVSSNALADVNVQTYGAVPDAIHFTDGTASGTGVSSPSGHFGVGDVGKIIKITNGYTNTAVFRGTISSVTNATTIILSGSVTSSCASTCDIYYGTNNATALNSAFTAAGAIPVTSNDKVLVIAPTATNGGGYMFASALTVPNNVNIDFEAPLYSDVGIGTGDNTIPLDAGDVSFTQLRLDVSGGRGPRLGQAGSNTAYIHYLEVDNVGFSGQAGLSCQGFGFIIDTINIQKGTIGTDWTGCYDIHGAGGVVSTTGSTYGVVIGGTEDFSFNISCDTVGTACFTADDAHNGTINARAFVNGSNTSSTALLGSLATGMNKGLQINFVDEAGGGDAVSIDYTRDTSINITALNSPLNSGVTNNISHCVNYGSHNAGTLDIMCDRDSAITATTGTVYGNLQDNSAGTTTLYGSGGLVVKSLALTGTSPPSGDGFYDPAPGVVATYGANGIIMVMEGVTNGVNYPQFTNAASSGGTATVVMQAKGSNTNIEYNIVGKGTGGVIVNTQSTTGIPLIVKGFPSQTTDLQQWKDGSSNVLANVENDGDINTVTKYKVNGTQVIGPRATGWGAQTGTASRAALATYAGITASNPPTQAQVQSVSDAVKALSQRFKGAADDLSTHGLIGP